MSIGIESMPNSDPLSAQARYANVRIRIKAARHFRDDARKVVERTGCTWPQAMKVVLRNWEGEASNLKIRMDSGILEKTGDSPLLPSEGKF